MSAFRWIGIVAAVIMILLVLGIAVAGAWLNTYIHSEAFKTEVETRAGRSLGGVVQIEKIDFDPFHGVKLQGLATQIQASRIQVATVHCTYAWTELLHRRLQLTGLVLTRPVITVGGHMPAAPTQPPTPGFADSGAAEGEGTAMPFQFILDLVKIKDGSVLVSNDNGVSTAELHGINAEADTSGYLEGRDVTGKLKIAEAILPQNIRITDFSTPFLSGQNKIVLQAKPFTALAFGGHIAGDYELTAGQDSDSSHMMTWVSSLELNARDCDVAQLTAATTSSSSAKLSGSLDIQSKWHAFQPTPLDSTGKPGDLKFGPELFGNLSGEGEAQLTDGKLQGVKLLNDLSHILNVKELNDPIIKKAQTHFTVQNSQLKFIGLQLDSSFFRITGDGTIGFDGALNAELVLILNRSSMQKLPAQAAASFVQQADGSGSIAFHVSGTTSNPQTDLPTRLLLQNTQIKNVINKALNKFFK